MRRLDLQREERMCSRVCESCSSLQSHSLNELHLYSITTSRFGEGFPINMKEQGNISCRNSGGEKNGKRDGTEDCRASHKSN